MPSRGLPGNANLEQLKKGAKSFQRAVRAGDRGAAEVVREFHPRLSDAQLGSPDLNGFSRTDAQLVIARQFGFASWPKLKAHLELVARYARSPHEQPVGRPLADEQAIGDEFLRLACLTYGDDDLERLRRARSLLEEHDWLERASIHTVAATGAVDAARELLEADPSLASLVGGPHRWEPLLYLTYSRVHLGSVRSPVAVARLLLEHGADPNAGYLWEGLVPPFTALTGALGGGGSLPRHPQELELLGRGVDPEGKGSRHPIYQGRSPVQEAALSGHMDVVSLLVDAGASWEHDQVDELVATAMAGDRDTVNRLLGENPGLRRRAIERCPDQLVRAAEQDSYEAVVLLIELGFDVNARPRTAPLHEAAMRGNLPVIRLLLDHGADPNIHDTGYHATPAGWAEHHGQREAQQLLEAREQPDPSTRLTDQPDRAVAAARPGSAMRTVSAAFTAVSEGRLDELGSMLAADIDWRGLPDEGGEIPRCAGRSQALERMRIGLLANSQVSVSAFVEDGDRVLAHVHPVDHDEVGLPERFLVAEVHDGQITNLRAYATEPEARDALHTDSPSTTSPDPE